MKQIFAIAVAITTITTPAFAGNGEQFMRVAIAPIPTEGGCLQAGQKGTLVFGGAGFVRSDGTSFLTQTSWETARGTAMAFAEINGGMPKVLRVGERYIGIACPTTTN